MTADCHIHMVLDGVDWRGALRRHRDAPDEGFLRRVLAGYQALGYTYLRDGGDRWGVGLRARTLAAEYGITFRTPLAPLYRQGHYGGFIGTAWESMADYARKVADHRKNGGDFIKIMISGLVDFDRFGVLTQPSLSGQEIRELIAIAHGEGMAVMVHANGADAVLSAAAGGADSIEHGAYASREALCAMAENAAVWVPTLSTVGNLRETGRYDESAVERILESQLRNVSEFAQMGGLIAPGSDAGAWAVPHGAQTELPLLKLALGSAAEDTLQKGIAAIRRRF